MLPARGSSESASPVSAAPRRAPRGRPTLPGGAGWASGGGRVPPPLLVCARSAPGSFLASDGKRKKKKKARQRSALGTAGCEGGALPGGLPSSRRDLLEGAPAATRTWRALDVGTCCEFPALGGTRRGLLHPTPRGKGVGRGGTGSLCALGPVTERGEKRAGRAPAPCWLRGCAGAAVAEPRLPVTAEGPESQPQAGLCRMSAAHPTAPRRELLGTISPTAELASLLKHA